MALTPEQIEDIATDWFSDEWAVARAIKLIEQVEAEVRKQDDALILQLVEALEGHQGNYKLTAREAEPVNDAIAAVRSRLLDSDLSKLTERGAKAWTGIDAQDLRDGGKP